MWLACHVYFERRICLTVSFRRKRSKCKNWHLESQQILQTNRSTPQWQASLLLFFDLQARATSEIAVADLSDSENR